MLDVACGTCVFTKEALRQEPTLRVEALDFNSEMLDQGRVRIEDAGLIDQVNLVQGDAMALPYADNTFDAAMSGFAMRNVQILNECYLKCKRVVKPGGKVVVLELANQACLVLNSYIISTSPIYYLL